MVNGSLPTTCRQSQPLVTTAENVPLAERRVGVNGRGLGRRGYLLKF